MKRNKILLLVAGLFLITYGNYLFAQPDYKVAEQDSLALVAFYNATDGPNWKSNQDGFGLDGLTSEWQEVYTGGWNKWLDGPVKDWFGVDVLKLPIPNSSDSAYRVVRVWPVIGRRSDGQNQMKGYIPREVGLLTALRDFRVNGNIGFTNTEIPHEIYHTALEYLDIEGCWFDGDISDSLKNTNIKKMNFRYNYIDYMPTLDFIDKDEAYTLNGTQWLYSTELSPAILEKTIDHFYTLSENTGEFSIEMRDINNVGDELEIVAPVGTAVEIECTSAGEKEEFITYQWYKDGLSKFGKKNRFYSISSVKESDYGNYTVKITNDYVKNYDANTNWGEIFTKEIHLVPEPVAPLVQWAKTTYNGKELHLRFSKPMNNEITGFNGFTITSGDRTIQVTDAKTTGRLLKDVYLKLDQNIAPDEELTLDFSGTEITDKNGGMLEAFTTFPIENMVRTAPAFVEARTTKDGTGIEVFFDNYIDPNSIEIEDFVISGDNNYSITYGSLQKGEIDQNISKSVLLLLSQSITDTSEELSVSYTQGELCGIYGGVSQSFTDESINNIVTVDFTPVLLYFEDGSKQVEHALVKGSWGLNPTLLYDDGTHGDESAQDHLWTTQLNLVDDNFSWNVVSRTIIQSYDTTSVTDNETGIITQTITPVTINQDSVLSENVLLEFQVNNENITGTTRFGIQNIDVVFSVTAENVTDQIYLMGIDDDWLTGIIAERTGDSDIYTVTLTGYTIGDVITYNYRDGNDWENQTTETRTYTVVAGDNIINDHFKMLSGLNDSFKKEIKTYPNPARNQITISGLTNFNQLEIYNICGQRVYGKSIYEDSVLLDISSFKAGIYYLRISNNHSTFSQKIIKTN